MLLLLLISHSFVTCVNVLFFCMQNAQIPGNLFIEEDQLEKICSNDINT